MGLDDEVFVVEVEGDDDGVGQLVFFDDLRILSDDFGELVLEKLVKVTLNALPSFGDILISKPHRRSPSSW